jgi:hypothetical protein
MQESVRCAADEVSAFKARHQQHLAQSQEKYLRDVVSLQNLIDTKNREVRE